MSRFRLFSDRFSTLFNAALIAAGIALSAPAAAQQDVSKVFTTYGGFWSSSVDTISNVKPDDSHMLLGFAYKNKIYSTGVSDSMLKNRSVPFQAASFRSFQLASNAIQTTASTKIGIGTKYGGAGNVSPMPVTNELTQYLTDGTNGLDLGTALFNLPGGQMRYKVTNIHADRIADGIPDVLVTQVGAPPSSSTRDTFRFEDSLGNLIGNALPIIMSNISIVGTGNWKFYDPGTPCSYNAGLQGDRPLRMMAFELADFGLNASNIGRISRFVHRVSGESDQAFVAYNNTAFSAAIGTVLPVTLERFAARKSGETAQLEWTVSEASRFSHFEVERSTSGAKFETLGQVAPRENTNGAYSFNDATPENGTNHYRLKMIDLDGSFTYSAVQRLNFSIDAAISVYPNPASSNLYVQTPNAPAMISVTNAAGITIPAIIATEGSRSRIDVSSLPAGLYFVRIQDGAAIQTRRVLVSH